jgi:hypothetical protein
MPIVIGGLLLSAFTKKNEDNNSKQGYMTPKRQAIYETALSDVTDPKLLLKLADAFEKEHLLEQAIMLRKRAWLRALPPEVKEKRDKVFRKAMASNKKDAILKLAKEFHEQGATGAARALYRRADGLQ